MEYLGSPKNKDFEKLRLEATIQAYREIIKLLQKRLQRMEYALNSESWHLFKNGSGEWAFSDDFPELKRILQEENCRGNRYLERNGYRYRLSGRDDKFIQRFKLKEAK